MMNIKKLNKLRAAYLCLYLFNFMLLLPSFLENTLPLSSVASIAFGIFMSDIYMGVFLPLICSLVVIDFIFIRRSYYLVKPKFWLVPGLVGGFVGADLLGQLAFDDKGGFEVMGLVMEVYFLFPLLFILFSAALGSVKSLPLHVFGLAAWVTYVFCKAFFLAEYERQRLDDYDQYDSGYFTSHYAEVPYIMLVAGGVWIAALVYKNVFMKGQLILSKQGKDCHPIGVSSMSPGFTSD